MLKLVAPIVAALCVVQFANAEDKKAKDAFDPAKIVGVWTIDSGVRAGDKVDKERLKEKITVTKDTFTIPAGPDQKFVIAYKIDAKAKPAAIDMEIKSGPVNEGKAAGIIAWDGDGYKLCYIVQEGGDTKRPTKFESTKDNNAFLFVLKPEKK